MGKREVAEKPGRKQITPGVRETLYSYGFYLQSYGKTTEVFEQKIRFKFSFEVTTGVGYRREYLYKSRGRQKQETSHENRAIIQELVVIFISIKNK